MKIHSSRVDMPGELYQYIKIHRQYYCLKQNPLILAWFLFFKNGAFQLRSGLDKRRVIDTVMRLCIYQLRLRSNSNVLVHPIFGNLCSQVHRGHKIFDFHHKTVVKIIAPEVDSALVIHEIERVRKAGSLPFAPNILRWDIKERWYEEDLVNGHPCYPVANSEPGILIEMFHKDIAPCLEKMILMQAPVPRNLAGHVGKIIAIMENRKLSRQGLDVNKVNRIRRFVETMVERLTPKGNCRIHLVWSHGDYSLVNILKTKVGIKVIDWEGLDLRNPLFDLYNYFFTEVYYKRSKANLVPEINEAISALESRLKAKLPDLANTLVSLAGIYRRLYYLERVCVLLERELSNNVLDVILRSIEVFNCYEEVEESRNLSGLDRINNSSA